MSRRATATSGRPLGTRYRRPEGASSRRPGARSVGWGLTLLLLALAGCTDNADGGGGDGGTGGEGGNGGGTGTGGGAGGQTHAVDIADFAFVPDTLSIAVGDRVEWTNLDSAPHSAKGQGFDTGRLDQGETDGHTFMEAGTFDYFCGFHPSMTATITVA